MTLDDMLALVDLDRYPVDRLDSPAGAALVSARPETVVFAFIARIILIHFDGERVFSPASWL